MNMFHYLTVGALACVLSAATSTAVRADDDDWEDRREDARERWEDAREEREERWEDYEDELEDRYDDRRYYYRSPRHERYYRPYTVNRPSTRYYSYPQGRYYDDSVYYDSRPYYGHSRYYDRPVYRSYRYGTPYTEYYGSSRLGYYERPYGREGVRLGPFRFEWDD